MLGTLAAAATLMVFAVAFAAPAAADTPTEFPFEFVFDDLNPCTGDVHTVRIAGTTTVHDHDGRIVAYSKRTITMSPTGFVGRGTDTYVLNGRVEMFSQADILTSPSGDRMRAVFVIVFDLSTGTVCRNGRSGLPRTGLSWIGAGRGMHAYADLKRSGA